MNERNKKIYAIVIAILFILSVATSFLPSIQVKADEQISFELTSLDFIASGRFTGIDSGFNYSLYETGYNNAISGNKFPLDALENVVSAERNPFPLSYDNLYDSLVSNFENYNYSVSFNDYGSGSTYNDLKAFISDPSAFNYEVIIGNSSYSSNPYFNIYFSHGDLKLCQVNKTVYAYSTDIIYNMNVPFNQNYTADYRDIHTFSANSLHKVEDALYNNFSTFPVFLTYRDNGISGDNDYSNYSTVLNLATAYLVNGVDSDFFIDRRLLFSNFVPDGYDVNSDPISQEKVGIYNFDFYPTGGVTSGTFVIDNLQLSKKASEMDDINLYALISFNYDVNALDYTYNENAFNTIQRHILQNYNEKGGTYKFVNNNNLETTVPLTDQTYQTFSSRSIMMASGPIDDSNGYDSGFLKYYNHSVFQGNKIHSFDMYDLYTISNQLNYVAPSQTSPKTLVSSSNGHVKNFVVTCSIKVDYGNGGVSETLATKSYNYLNGQVTSSGLTSVDKNTPLEDIPSGVQGMLDNINKGGFNDGVGGNVNNNPSNSNVNNPSFVNNNNPTINIDNSNSGGMGVAPEAQEGMIGEIWSIWSSWKFLKEITQRVTDNEFIEFIFSGDLYQLPLMDIVIPSVAVIVFVSIASTVIRFIRGN